MKITTLQNLGIKFIGLYCAASALSDELSDSKQIFETGLGLLGVFVITSTISFVVSILITSLEKIRRVGPG